MTYRPDPQDAFAADELAAYEAEMDALAAEADEDWDEFADYCDEHDGQPDEQQEWDDLYGYGPEFDSYDGYDEY